jgi:hypothetical protein
MARAYNVQDISKIIFVLEGISPLRKDLRSYIEIRRSRVATAAKIFKNRYYAKFME